MSRTPKYKAKCVFWDSKDEMVKSGMDIEIYRCHGKLKLPDFIWRFDSQHEFKVYLELARIFGADKIKRQYPLAIIPPGRCYPNGKVWRIDFAIASEFDEELCTHYIEAKGAFLPEFATTLALFEYQSPCDFNELFVVFNRKLPTNNRVIKSLLKTDFKDNLLSLKELERLASLPCLS